MDKYFIHNTSLVEQDVKIGEGTKIWHFSHIDSEATIGENCVIGQNVYIGKGVKIGNGCKIQNNVSIFNGVTLEDDVFCGPSCVFTNVLTPRAFIEKKDEFLLTLVERGASIGANATIVCGTNIGKYSLIGAGAVVTKNVKQHSIVRGLPAKQNGWVCFCGEKLTMTTSPFDFECYNCLKKYNYIGTEDVGYLEEIKK